MVMFRKCFTCSTFYGVGLLELRAIGKIWCILNIRTKICLRLRVVYNGLVYL